MANIVVVIPAYKTNLDIDERISLLQVFSVLSAYDITFVVPDGFDISYEEVIGKKYSIEFFESDYFKSTKDYSRLCTSIDFYERFFKYDYMLIYQLDAFVFSDRMNEFCERGYDYFGAPVPKIYWGDLTSSVGNGGFSLRKISKVKAILEHKDDINKYISEIKDDCWKFSLINNEDEYILYGAKLFPEVGFRIPSIKEAFDFSIEYNIGGIYQNLEDHIPFGCHRWSRYKLDKWWPIIAKYGYSIDPVYYKDLLRNGRDYVFNLEVLKQIIGNKTQKEQSDLAKTVLGDNIISIWGLGKSSSAIIELLKQLGLTIANRYDKNVSQNRKAIYPSESALINEKYAIVITSTKYGNEIKQEVQKLNPVVWEKIYSVEDIIYKYIDVLNIDEIGEQ